MTEHTQMMKRKAQALEAEAWGKQVAYISGQDGIIETCYNNGVRKFEENKPGGRKWTEGEAPETKTLLQAFSQWIADHRGK